MTISGTPTNLGELRAALIERCQLDPNDPDAAAALLNADINEAIQRFDMANPSAWPWDWQDGLWNPIGVGTPDPQVWGPTLFVSKIRDVFIGSPTPTDAPTWQAHLQRMTREEQLERWPTDNARGQPASYSIGGVDGATEPNIALYLRPLADQPYQLRIVGFQPINDLAADDKPNPVINDYQIDDWAQLVLEYAAFLTYRRYDDLSEAVAAKAVFDQGVLELRRQQRRTLGAGVPGRTIATELDTP